MTRMKVPAYVEIGTEWVQVGWANVDLSMHSADITINEDAPAAQALAALMASKAGPAIAFPTHEPEIDFNRNMVAMAGYIDDDSPAVLQPKESPKPYPHAESITSAINAHEPEDRPDTMDDTAFDNVEVSHRSHPDHKPIEHNDGRAPWCSYCSFDENYREPAILPLSDETVEKMKKASPQVVINPVHITPPVAPNIHLLRPPRNAWPV